MKKFLYSIVILFFFGNITAQSIEKQWIFSDIQSQDGASLV
ncbi:MAG: hypothetical protein ACI8RH_000787, partial [Flavobacteriales bacterium]